MKTFLFCFYQDKSAEFSTGTSVGTKNNIYAILVMGVYEVLMEYNFIKANYRWTSLSCGFLAWQQQVEAQVIFSVCMFGSKSGFEELLELFNRHHKLSEILREKSGKGRVPSHKIPRSLFSMGFTSNLITVLFR